MSWSEYLSGYLINYTNPSSGKIANNVCDSGAIIGFDGTPWAATAGFTLDNYSTSVDNGDGTSTTEHIDEFSRLHNAFQSAGRNLQRGGIRIHHEKYYVISFDEENQLMYLRKQNGGACVAKSNNAYVVGTFSEARTITNLEKNPIPQSPGATNRSVQALQRLLLDNNV